MLQRCALLVTGVAAGWFDGDSTPGFLSKIFGKTAEVDDEDALLPNEQVTLNEKKEDPSTEEGNNMSPVRCPLPSCGR